jgi:hypothetical protein
MWEKRNVFVYFYEKCSVNRRVGEQRMNLKNNF